MKTKLICIIVILFQNLTFGQNKLDVKSCDIKFAKQSEKTIALKASDINCLAQKSNTEILVYLYEFWCKPCNEKILKLKKLQKVII